MTNKPDCTKYEDGKIPEFKFNKAKDYNLLKVKKDPIGGSGPFKNIEFPSGFSLNTDIAEGIMKDFTDYGSTIKDYAYCELPVLKGGNWVTGQLNGIKLMLENIGNYLSLVLSIILAQNFFLCVMIFSYLFKLFKEKGDEGGDSNLWSKLLIMLLFTLFITVVGWYVIYYLFEEYITSNINILLEDE